MTGIDFFRAIGLRGLLLVVGLASMPGIASHTPESTPDPLPSGVAISINSEHLIELYQSTPNLKIIDARHYEDHTLGHIERSLSLPVTKMKCDDLAALTEGPDAPIVFYCNGGGGSSTRAISIASNCGYRRLFWLEGGFIEWKHKDYPYVVD